MELEKQVIDSSGKNKDKIQVVDINIIPVTRQ